MKFNSFQVDNNVGTTRVGWLVKEGNELMKSECERVKSRLNHHHHNQHRWKIELLF
jgi:hypothetical protein